MVSSSLHADSLFYALNPTGRYQRLHLLLVSLGVLPTLIQLLDNVFIGGAVSHHCARPETNTSILSLYHSHLDQYTSPNTSVTFDECHIRLKEADGKVISEKSCQFGVQYDGPESQSVVSQLGLVCDNAHLLRITQTLVFTGQGLGAMVGPFFSDRYGRKRAMAFSNLILMALGMVIAFAPNYIVFAVTKFFIGAVQQSVYIPVSIYTGELLPTEYRRYSIIISCVAWSISGCTMTLVAFMMRDQPWRYLQAVLSLSSLGAVVQLCFMDESIVWLLANNKHEEAVKCVKRAARLNGKNYEGVIKAGYSKEYLKSNDDKPDQEDHIKLENSSNDSQEDGDKCKPTCPMLPEANYNVLLTNTNTEKNGDTKEKPLVIAESSPQKMSFIHILKVKRLFINAIAMWFTWLSASLCYFTLYFLMSTLAGDKYLNYILTSLMDIPACFIFFFGFNRFGRRSVTILLYSILAVGTFALGLLRHFTDASEGAWSVIQLLMSLLSIVGGSGCFFSIFFYLPELFPTNLRNQATGFASFFARIGAMISPFMATLAEEAIWLPGFVMAICATIAVFLLTLLPETKDKELPQTIEEMESWYSKDSPQKTKDKNENTQTLIV